MSTDAKTPRLSHDEVAHYQEQGYVLHKRPVLPPNDFDRLKEMFEGLLAQYGPDGLDTPHFRHPELLEFLLSDAVLDLVEPVVGPNIGLWSSHFISKDPFKGKATPWHEDSSYWEGRTSTMEGICTVWLALDRATPENGSMAVIPGSQRNGFSDYQDVEDASVNIFPTEIVAVDESKAVYFSLEPNEASLHEARIVHGAKANTSPYRRAGYTMRYFPTTTRIYQEDPRNAGFKIWLARGEDRAGNRYENA
ncbi:phytanoyl-CoA dioxygenase family protein [bacterium]|nr:MAG: phytanoyl-CoA dioxygenase family protein [bacterium]